MLWTNFRRVLRSGSINVLRNSFVSLASIFVMTMTLIIVGSLLFLNALLGQFVLYVKDKVDVNIYFHVSTSEKAVLELKAAIEALPEVSYVTYTSREDAEKKFRAKHQNDQVILQSLDELGENPLGAALAVKAKEPSQYEGIAQFLEDRTTQSDGSPFVELVNYAQNKEVISQLELITRYVERFGWFAIFIFTVASVLITFNTIRLAIYTAREEISVMRLVGASNMYIRGPFVVEGTLYGAASGIIALAAFFPLAWLFRGGVEFLFGMDIFTYYLDHFLVFLLILLGSGIILGALSSFLAVRKYLSI